MKTLNRLIGTAIILSSLIACEKENDKLPKDAPKNIEEAITGIFQPMIDGDTVIGISVGVIDNGETNTFFFGETQVGNSQKPDSNTLFEIGSITKTMTSVILAQMVLDGDIALDDAVEDYLPEVQNFPNYTGQKITFKHLANHTSALPYIPENYDQNGFDESNPFKNYTETLLYEFLDGYELTYAPGTKQEYSNLGMGLLGNVLGKLKNTSFEELLEQYVFSNLNLNRTYVTLPENETNFATPYNGNLKAVPMWDMSDATLGTGGVKSSLTDMMQYLKANMGYATSSLDDALALTHETTQELNYPFTMGLGWGKIVDQQDGKHLIWHNGGTAGTVTFLGFVPELDLGVVILFNTEINERIGQDYSLELIKGVEVIRELKRFRS